MITCQGLEKALKTNGFQFFTGVPDSTFKDWLLFLEEPKHSFQHVLACNETSSIAIAAGYHLATGDFPIVYMQNSGLGNTVNPLTSLADQEVYSIPMVLFIGWRGEPGKKDEPQHKKMGRVMNALLDSLEIPHQVLPDEENELEQFWAGVKKSLQDRQGPHAVIIPKGIFSSFSPSVKKETPWTLVREDAIKLIVDRLSGQEAIVSTTGKVSRELYEYRSQLEQGHQNDFYTVGSLGCASSIAVGIAYAKPQQKVLVFDADGSALMHLGSWSTVGHYKFPQLKHIVFDNEAHESTGGQTTHSGNVDFVAIAEKCGYAKAQVVSSREELEACLGNFLEGVGPELLVIKVKKGSRPNLGRPTTTPIENKVGFMNFLQR